MKKKLYLIFILSIVILSCKPNKGVIFSRFSNTYDDGSREVEVFSEFNKEKMFFGTNRVLEFVINYKNLDNDSCLFRIWYPTNKVVDTSKLVVLISGYDESSLTLAPIALETTKLGLITAFIPLRGNREDLMGHLNPTYGLKEPIDVKFALDAFMTIHNLKTLNAVIYGVSLGGVIAVEVTKIDPRIKGLCVEGLPFDIELSAKRMLQGNVFSLIYSKFKNFQKDFYFLSPARNLSNLRKEVPIFALWGTNDKIVTKSERDSLKYIIKTHFDSFKFLDVEGGGHIFRLGFPLSQDSAIELNRNIALFLLEVLKQ